MGYSQGGNEPLCCIKCGECVHWLLTYGPLSKDCAPELDIFIELSAHLAVFFSELRAPLIVLSWLTWMVFPLKSQSCADSCHPEESAPLPGRSHLWKIRDIMLLTMAVPSTDCINIWPTVNLKF
jgi:hypothetical protein